ncbi:MAG: hypothetical protein QXY15_11035 [Candidatus Nitrosotenuis sp.]
MNSLVVNPETMEMINQLNTALTQIYELVTFLLAQPVVVLALGFIVMTAVIYNALRNSNVAFSDNSSIAIAVIMSLFGAGIVAANLEKMGIILAYIVIVGVPAAVGYGLMRARRGVKIPNE